MPSLEKRQIHKIKNSNLAPAEKHARLRELFAMLRGIPKVK